MPSVDDASLNHNRHIATWLKLVSIQEGLLLQKLDYHSVRRMVEIDDEEVVANESCDDGLAEILVEGFDSLRVTVGDQEVHPLGSIAALFETGDLQRSIKPKAWMAIDLRAEEPEVVSVCTTCNFIQDETLGTNLFTPRWLRERGLPRLGPQWCFVDVVASRKRPAGPLLVLSAYLAACRGRMDGVCAICVTTKGRDLFQSLGFNSHTYRDKGAKYFCYLGCGEMQFRTVARKMQLNESVMDICWRMGLTARTRDRVVGGRC